VPCQKPKSRVCFMRLRPIPDMSLHGFRLSGCPQLGLRASSLPNAACPLQLILPRVSIRIERRCNDNGGSRVLDAEQRGSSSWALKAVVLVGLRPTSENTEHHQSDVGVTAVRQTQRLGQHVPLSTKTRSNRRAGRIFRAVRVS
jgi:hypothetical protein